MEQENIIAWKKELAEKGLIQAQYALGYAYYVGAGVEVDYQQSVYWFTSAALQNDAMSQAYLGTCYSEGLGVEYDEEKAVYWWKKVQNKDVLWLWEI